MALLIGAAVVAAPVAAAGAIVTAPFVVVYYTTKTISTELGGTSRRRDYHLLHPPLPLVDVSIWMERVCQQNDRTLADG